MNHGVYLIRSREQQEAFHGLILPEILDRLEEDAVFLIGAVEDALPVGAAVLELEASRAQLLSIAVTEDRRRQGIGSALLRQCVRVLRRTSIQSVYAILTRDDAEAAALFASFGMTVSDAGSAYYSVPLSDAIGQPVLRGKSKKAVPMDQLPSLLLRDYLRRIFPGEQSGEDHFDSKLSHFLVENYEITACLLAERDESSVTVSWIDTHSREKLALLYLLRGALTAAEEICPPETEIRFATYEPLVTQLIEQLVPMAEKCPIQSWGLSPDRFRLTDTTPTGWEDAEAARQEG